MACEKSDKPDALENIIHNNVLKVGTRFGLTTYYNGVSGPQGFEYELVKGFAEFLDVRLEIYPYYNLDELIPDVGNPQVDIIAAGLTITQDRQQNYRFGPVYQQVSQKLVFKQGGIRPRKMADLTGSLMVTRGSSHAEIVDTFRPSHENVNWQETSAMDEEELLVEVLEEKLDYTVADSNMLALMRRRHPELSIGFTVQPEQNMAWALNKHQDDSLYAALIEYFGQIQANGTLATLEDKYFGHVRQFNYVDTRAFIKAAETVLPKYQHLFETYAGNLDWRFIAAQSYQESHWKPRAKSRTGVRGMMMLTLGTAKDYGVKSRIDAEQSIRGGAKYMNSLVRRIPDRIDYPDRLWFALAAYNVGLGHVEDARILTQEQGGNPDMWVDVKKRLPLLKQKKYYKKTKAGYARGDEAIQYVSNIRGYYDTLVYFDDNRSKTSHDTEQESIAAQTSSKAEE